MKKTAKARTRSREPLATLDPEALDAANGGQYSFWSWRTQVGIALGSVGIRPANGQIPKWLQ
jgi:hypothetical protein